jgi:hypothetical protein
MMGLLDLAGGLLQQYLGATPGQANASADQHFDQVARQAPTDMVSKGLAAAFRSDQTPPFAQMAAQMFGQATPEQKQALLAELQGMLGPAGASLQASGAAATPATVQSALEQAQARNPSIVDRVSDFYAQHPGLIKTLGSAALTIALAKMAEHARQG